LSHLQPPPTTITLGAIAIGYLKKQEQRTKENVGLVQFQEEEREAARGRNAQVVIWVSGGAGTAAVCLAFELLAR
jgi:predicted Rossmann-fold nucleotide-binding protein